jgi:predicted ATP-dependent serine protease
MTNWQPKETTVFICPDCGHEQQEMTKNCPACGGQRLPLRTAQYRLYQVVFHSNLGNRKDKYRVLLTEAQLEMLTDEDEQEAYEMIQSELWDQVVGMYSDHGCYFDAMTFNAKCLDEES